MVIVDCFHLPLIKNVENGENISPVKENLVEDVYRMLYLKGVIRDLAFAIKEYDDMVYFAIDANNLYPYREDIRWAVNNKEKADEIDQLIFIRNNPVCKYSGATQLTAPMITYRKNGWNVGSSCEIELVSELATPYAEYIRNIRQEKGIRECIRELFNLCLE